MNAAMLDGIAKRAFGHDPDTLHFIRPLPRSRFAVIV
jgi:hypothetical protein